MMQHPAVRDRYSKVLSSTLLLVLCASLWTYGGHPFRHTIEDHPQWKSTKLQLARAVMGSVAFMRTPFAVQGERLNLGAFWGYQEVIHAREGALQELRVELDIPHDSYVSVLYGITPERRSGIFLSRREGVESHRFVADSEGRFVQREPLPDVSLPERVNVRLMLENDTRTLVINDDAPRRWRSAETTEGGLGFRGGMRDVYVGRVEATFADGPRLVETFEHPKPWWTSFAWTLLALGALGTLSALWQVFRHRQVLPFRGAPKTDSSAPANLWPGLRTTWGLATTVAVVLLTVQGLSTLVSSRAGAAIHWHVIKHLPSIVSFAVQNALGKGEDSRITDADGVLTELRERYRFQRDPQVQRIVFVGSSQTWGAGASHPDAIWVRRIEKALEQRGLRVQCINTGISGATAPQMWELYRDEWARYRPDQVVINVGNNDVIHAAFKEALVSFLEFNRKDGIDTLLVLEANAPDGMNPALLEKHQIMREIARTYEVPVVDLHGYLEERDAEGFLWWDFVHLTDYGQALAAELITERLIDMRASLRRIGGRPS